MKDALVTIACAIAVTCFGCSRIKPVYHTTQLTFDRTGTVVESVFTNIIQLGEKESSQVYRASKYETVVIAAPDDANFKPIFQRLIKLREIGMFDVWFATDLSATQLVQVVTMLVAPRPTGRVSIGIAGGGPVYYGLYRGPNEKWQGMEAAEIMTLPRAESFFKEQHDKAPLSTVELGGLADCSTYGDLASILRVLSRCGWKEVQWVTFESTNRPLLQ